MLIIMNKFQELLCSNKKSCDASAFELPNLKNFERSISVDGDFAHQGLDTW